MYLLNEVWVRHSLRAIHDDDPVPQQPPFTAWALIGVVSILLWTVIVSLAITVYKLF